MDCHRYDINFCFRNIVLTSIYTIFVCKLCVIFWTTDILLFLITELLETMSEYIEVIGKIVAVLPGTMFRVELQNKHVVLAHISGKLRKNFIKLMIGDIVKMEMSPQDLQKARIIFRMKNADVQRNAPIRSFGPRSKR